jgi:hypothetical protein
MSFIPPDQQPIFRTVGRRTRAPAGIPPSRQARDALDALANRLTHAPKGVFRYSNHDEMERDRDLWRALCVVETVRARG